MGYAVGTPGQQQVGFGFERVTRAAYYAEVHPQTIAFEIAREVVQQLTDTASPNSKRLRGLVRAHGTMGR